MNRNISKLFALGLMALLSSKSISAQTIVENNPVGDAASNNLKTYYDKAINQQSRLYNGKEYEFYPLVIDGSAYFNDVKFWQKGSVTYNGVKYDSIPLMYDLNKELLIGLLYDGVSKYSFISEKVSDFNLFDHYFVRLQTDSNIVNSSLKTGFYDLMYNGKLKLLVKRSKSIQQKNIREIQQYFLAKDYYYLVKDGYYYPISSESSFMSLFKEEKKEFRQYLKNNHIKFRREPERAMVMLATYYESLLN